MRFSLLLVPVLILVGTLTSATSSASASPAPAMNTVERDILHFKNVPTPPNPTLPIHNQTLTK